MNKLLSCLLGLLVSQAVYSQKDYFVYLQSEGGQPFFVRMNEQTYSSSANGYLILSRMRDSSYTFRVGWPGKPEEQPYFTVKVGAKDRGLLLKHFTGEGWGLFDLQSMEMVKSHAAPASNSSVKLEPRPVSNFTDVLAKAANDPTLRMKEVKVEKPVVKEEKKEAPVVVKKEEPRKEPVKEVTAPIADTVAIVAEKKETPALAPDTLVKKTDPIAEELQVAQDTVAVVKPQPKAEEKTIVEEKPVLKQEEPVVKEEKPAAKQEEPVVQEQRTETSYARSKVSRRSESSTTEGFSLTFVDEYVDGHRDTIKILIPNAPKAWQKEPAKVSVAEEKKFLDIPVTASDSTKTSVKANNCQQKASESDFLKLRKKMAAATTDDGMIREAKKGFEQKCYTVKQVRNLGSLFLNDAAKFQFFEAASKYVSDADNLPAMGDDLKNEYYLRRFKKVLEER